MTKGNQGISSKNVVQKPVRTGVGNRGVSVGAVGQLGQKQGSHTTHGGETSYRGEGPIHQGAALRPAMMGNEIAAKTVCGPGGSRTVHASGSQGMTGRPDPGNPGLPSTKGQWPDTRR